MLGQRFWCSFKNNVREEKKTSEVSCYRAGIRLGRGIGSQEQCEKCGSAFSRFVALGGAPVGSAGCGWWAWDLGQSNKEKGGKLEEENL